MKKGFLSAVGGRLSSILRKIPPISVLYIAGGLFLLLAYKGLFNAYFLIAIGFGVLFCVLIVYWKNLPPRGKAGFRAIFAWPFRMIGKIFRSIQWSKPSKKGEPAKPSAPDNKVDPKATGTPIVDLDTSKSDPEDQPKKKGDTMKKTGKAFSDAWGFAQNFATKHWKGLAFATAITLFLFSFFLNWDDGMRWLYGTLSLVTFITFVGGWRFVGKTVKRAGQATLSSQVGTWAMFLIVPVLFVAMWVGVYPFLPTERLVTIWQLVLGGAICLYVLSAVYFATRPILKKG